MNGGPLKRLLVLVCGLAAATSLIQVAVPASAFAQTIVDEWSTVKAPPAPELKSVTIDPKVTALLILDIQKQNCNMERRPRCVASVPKIQGLLARTRAKGVPVIYSLGAGTAADIYQEVAPLGGEPVVTSGPDKFLGTDLEKILMRILMPSSTPHGTS